ncbi:MAG: CD1247 N-terminal domain-containing protein [Clostridium sp.]|uniref:CD1247 N-terminal domain-containing protein n=1 Tax=Clostridium sp. TaxID=1506 RepID=UPI003F3C0FA8
MNHIREEIQELNSCIDKVSNNENKEILCKISSILNTLTSKVEEISVNQEIIEENLEYLDDDLSGIQDELFEEVSLEELNEIEEEYKEINCSHCNKPIFIEASALEENNDISCPYCGGNVIG